MVVDGVKDEILPFEMKKSSIILMGGQNISGYKNDVWRSTDNGATWTQIPTGLPMWSARAFHSSVVMPDSSIVLMGGYDGAFKNDVWRSTDNGATWTQITAQAADMVSKGIPFQCCNARR